MTCLLDRTELPGDHPHARDFRVSRAAVRHEFAAVAGAWLDMACDVSSREGPSFGVSCARPTPATHPLKLYVESVREHLSWLSLLAPRVTHCYMYEWLASITSARASPTPADAVRVQLPVSALHRQRRGWAEWGRRGHEGAAATRSFGGTVSVRFGEPLVEVALATPGDAPATSPEHD